MSEEIDHEYTDEIVCPYCGHGHSDSFESGDSGKMECDECEKSFKFERIVSVDYSTEKMQ